MLKYEIPSEVNLDQIKEWIAQDPFHKDTSESSFWIPALDKDGKPELGVRHVAVCDEEGVVFYLRMSNVMRVDVQFPPQNESRIARALKEAFSFVYVKAREMGYKEMIFESFAPALIKFFENLGFKTQKDQYGVKIL